jgi:hypothetical protein
MNDKLEVSYAVRQRSECAFCGSTIPDDQADEKKIHIKYERDDPFGRGNIVTAITLSPELAKELCAMICDALMYEGPVVIRHPVPAGMNRAIGLRKVDALKNS